ncbi:hypothetical protein M8818_001778 [Zalaria obscura]|uniref:Uncharacterized protein n=1 Tax=Zalaria obscura TaxID=2024903 RepID=A0ACC3SNV6_9PEZI
MSNVVRSRHRGEEISPVPHRWRKTWGNPHDLPASWPLSLASKHTSSISGRSKSTVFAWVYIDALDGRIYHRTQKPEFPRRIYPIGSPRSLLSSLIVRARTIRLVESNPACAIIHLVRVVRHATYLSLKGHVPRKKLTLVASELIQAFHKAPFCITTDASLIILELRFGLAADLILRVENSD